MLWPCPALPADGKLHFAISSDASDTEEIAKFLDESVRSTNPRK
jgi:hypothetical protein